MLTSQRKWNSRHEQQAVKAAQNMVFVRHAKSFVFCYSLEISPVKPMWSRGTSERPRSIRDSMTRSARDSLAGQIPMGLINENLWVIHHLSPQTAPAEGTGILICLAPSWTLSSLPAPLLSSAPPSTFTDSLHSGWLLAKMSANDPRVWS
jgi:hypothetical protein